MDHMNLFFPFENKDASHEDVLTRNYLYLLKALPEVRDLFLSQIVSCLPDVKMLSTLTTSVKTFEVQTQVDSGNNYFDGLAEKTNVLSVLISDERLQERIVVECSDRHARYDGVVQIETGDDVRWLFIIENKPFVENVWWEQLNLNLGRSKDRVSFVDRPCCLSWRKIIDELGDGRVTGKCSVPAKVIISDFLMYVNQAYSWLKPFDTFRKCESNMWLLQNRCRDILSEFAGCDAAWHKGWMYKVDSGDDRIKQIGFDGAMIDDEWVVAMWLYAGDTMSAARESYRTLNVGRLERLLRQYPSFCLQTNFHFSFMQRNLVWFHGRDGLKPLDYIEYWKLNHVKITQISRDNFGECCDKLMGIGFATKDECAEFNKKIVSKEYAKVNTCPGFLLKYTWSQNLAMALDDERKFVNDFRRIKNLAFDVFD